MVSIFLPMLYYTVFWAGIGIGIPMMTPKGPYQGIIRCMCMLTGITCWLFWLCCYMVQMNPLVGPRLTKNQIFIIYREWG